MRNVRSDCAGASRDYRDYGIRKIIAGTRGYSDREYFFEYMDAEHAELKREAPGESILYISGAAKTGADALAIEWCELRGHPYLAMPADWDDITVEGAVVKINKRGKQYNARAGMTRNEDMAKIATDLIVWWDLKSKGTKEMYRLGKQYKLIRSCVAIDTDEEE